MKRLHGVLTILFLITGITPAFSQGSWIQVASLDHQRQRHSASLLDSGKLLVAGGAYDFWGEVATSTCELYDPATDSWSYTGSMIVERSSHTATTLPDGRILVTGGYAGGGYATATCEIYDPSTGSWSLVDSMSTRRYRHQAILLNDDSVLVVGGRQGNVDGYGSMAIWSPLSSCEIYSISNNTWTPAGSMNEMRTESGLSLLPDGRVLAAGGIHDLLIMSNWAQPATASCELYDPVTDTWSIADSLVYPRNFVRLVTLDNNSVLSVGGELDKDALSDCHLFSIDSSSWMSTGSLNAPRIVSEVLKLPTGDIMTVGGWAYLWSKQTGTAEIYDVANDAWDSMPPMQYRRGWHTATLLDNGDVIVVGGTSDSNVALKSCEIFQFATPPLTTFAISDVPNDEGGQVRIYWTAHTNDAASQGSNRVARYRVYVNDEESGNTVTGLPAGKWREVGNIAATNAKRYSATVPTLATSTLQADAPSTYVVVAESGSGKSYVAAPAIGRSYDNRGPERVSAVSVAKTSDGYQLSWQGSQSQDVRGYAIYRGNTPNFPVSPASRIGTTSSLTYSDYSAPSGKAVYYRVQAVDNYNNPGLATPPSNGTLSTDNQNNASTGLTVGVNYPQPFSTSTTIPVQLSNPTNVTVEIFDNLSRRVAQLTDLQLPAGNQRIMLSAEGIPSGRYTCVITAGNASKALSIIVQK